MGRDKADALGLGGLLDEQVEDYGLQRGVDGGEGFVEEYYFCWRKKGLCQGDPLGFASAEGARSTLQEWVDLEASGKFGDLG